MKPEPTFIYKDDKTYIMVEGSVVGAVDDDALIEEEAERLINQSATHIVTPNGLKGKILGRVQDVWGEQVTVRFENGRIVQLPVSRVSFTHEADQTETSDPIEALSKRVEASVDSDLTSLKVRSKELDKIKAEARVLIDGGKLSTTDLQRVGELLTQARYEQGEIDSAMAAHVASIEESTPQVAPFEMRVATQGGPSRGDLWLDAPLNEMIAEANATDYEQLMNEGPEALVAELEGDVLADAGAVRNIAASWIQSRTAAADEDVRTKYEKVWLERVESVRRAALVQYKDVSRKEAAVQEQQVDDSTDEALFM